jgi:hypothetical protein
VEVVFNLRLLIISIVPDGSLPPGHLRNDDQRVRVGGIDIPPSGIDDQFIPQSCHFLDVKTERLS